MALKALRTVGSPERAREVWSFQTGESLLFTHVSFPGRQRLERELPGWAALRFQNFQELHGMYIPRTLPPSGSLGRIGIVTDIGSRLYMVNGSSHARKYDVDSGSLGVAMAGKWKLARLRQRESSIG